MRRAMVVLLSLLCAAAGRGEEGTIQGTITDGSTGKPLSGAHVAIDAPAVAAAAGLDGRFILSGIPAGSRRIRFSFVGYLTETRDVVVPVGDTLILNPELTPSLIPGTPVTVTASRGKERETPAAFAGLARTEIRDRYTTQDIPVLLSELPSSTYYSESGNGIGYTYLNIRGFDSRRIAVMINGIPQNDPEDHNVYWLDFPDLAGTLEDVQVQRGAGSAFYGPPAIGGSVNLVTNQFGSERSLQVSAGMGSFNTRRYAASFSSGLIDNRYAFHGRLSKIQSDGYRERSWTDFGSYFFGAIRYDGSMTTQINFYGGPVADHLAYYGIPKAFVTDRAERRTNPIARNEELENFSQPHYELYHEWRLSPTLTLNNTFFYVTGDGFFDYDGSWGPLSYFRMTPQQGFPVTGDPDTILVPGALIRAYVANKQYGWLPRVTIVHPAGELILGAELRIHRSLHWGRLEWAQQLPPQLPDDYHYYEFRGAKDIASLYAHEQYHPAPNVSLMFSLQYAYNRYRLYDEKFIGTDFSVPYHFLNPRAGVNWNLDVHWNAYLSAAYTSREPRLNNLYDAAEASTPVSWGAVVPQFGLNPSGGYDFNNPLIKPESLVDVELGTGYSSEQYRAGVNLYWMEFSDEIVKSGRVDRFGQPVTGNAERTRHIGIELTGHAAPIPGLAFDANATFSRNRLIRHLDYSTGQELRLDGNPIAGFPDLLGNVRLSYAAGPVTFAWATRFVGKQYTDNLKIEEHSVDPFTVSNASLTWKLNVERPDIGLELKLQVNNVFDVLYAAYGEGDQFFVGAERNVFFNLQLSL